MKFTLDYVSGLFVVLDPHKNIKFSTNCRLLAMKVADKLNGELQ